MSGDEGEGARPEAARLLPRASSTVGVDPAIMGIGPVPAVQQAAREDGAHDRPTSTSFEINEAFASQAVYCQRELGIPDEKLNVNGGAIALGHPLGCTGAKLTAHAALRAAPPRRQVRHRHDVHRRRHGRRGRSSSASTEPDDEELLSYVVNALLLTTATRLHARRLSAEAPRP